MSESHKIRRKIFGKSKRARIDPSPREPPTMICYVNPDLKSAIELKATSKALARCCLVYVSELYLKAAERDDVADFLPLHSGLSRRIYTTRFYGAMLALLKKLSATQVFRDGSYRVGKESKRYRLNPAFATNVQPWAIDCGNLEGRLDDAFTTFSYATMSGAARKWIVRTYKRASFSPNLSARFDSHPFKTREARICSEHHLENIRTARLRFKVCRVSGRVYYPVANLPKVFRSELLIDGQPVVEIDISASQPTLLATIYPKACAEKEKYLAFVQSGRFYESVADWAGANWSRAEAKTEFFNQIAFGSFYCAATYPLLVPFTEQFPVLAGLMAEIKKGGNAELPLKMQTLEAKIAIDGACGECAQKELMILPVHDSLICKQVDTDQVAEIFARHWRENTGIPARLKVA